MVGCPESIKGNDFVNREKMMLRHIGLVAYEKQVCFPSGFLLQFLI
jgi:hypothetical protein